MPFIYKGKDHTNDIPPALYNITRHDLKKYKQGQYESLSELMICNFDYFSQLHQYQFNDDEDFIVAMVMYVALDILKDKGK